MKKEMISKILFVLSIVLVVCFIIAIIIDYANYDSLTNSAPFEVDILLRAIEFIFPSTIIYIIASILRKKSQK